MLTRFAFCCRIEKDKSQLKHELDDLHSQMEQTNKGKVSP